jgi:glycerol-1-phosphate dehydrogenase [NAD(P)+]
MMNEKKFFESTPEELAGSSYSCSCGKIHRVATKKIVLEEGALGKVYEVIQELGLGQHMLLVADQNTWRVAGQNLEIDLIRKGQQIKSCIMAQEQLHADEKFIGRILTAMEDNTECLIAVGSGTINDAVRFASFRLHIPYIIIATAPSMDGYASTVSPLLVEGYKKTFIAVHPLAIIGDLLVIKEAPQEMLAAGFGDMLGKATALADWMLSSIMENEYYCPDIVKLTCKAMQQCVSCVDGLVQRESDAIKHLMEGLILSGLAMQMAGNSRPASGAEHHLAHFWEMQHFMRGEDSPLHGIKVGVATPLIMKLYDKVFAMDETVLTIQAKDSQQLLLWKQHILQCYGSLVDTVLKENTNRNLSQIELEKKIQHYIKEKKKIQQEVGALFTIVKEGKNLMKELKGPTTPMEMKLDIELLMNGLLYAKEVRARYTILQLADELGLLERFTKEIVDEQQGK